MKSVVHLRISDNVLQHEDWPIVEATIVDGRITELKELHPGAYVWLHSVFIGMTLETLLRWLKYDPTGTHPEIHHQLKHPRQPRTEWRSPTKMESLKRIIEDAAV